MSRTNETCSVSLSGPTNSTLFSTCCHVAVCDHHKACPSCGKRVVPGSPVERWESAYAPYRWKPIRDQITSAIGHRPIGGM